MAISGLVLTLEADASAAQGALITLASDSRVEVGERFGHRLAILTETGSPREDRALWDELHSIEGVLQVELAFVHLDNLQHIAASPCLAQGACDTTCSGESHA